MQPARRIVVNSRRSTATAMAEEAPAPSRMPTACLVKPGAARRDLLRPTMGFPNRRFPDSTCSHGQARRSPSGTKLGTTMHVEAPNCSRIRSLEGNRPRIDYPVLLAGDRGLSPVSTMGDQRLEVFVMPVAATRFFSFEIFLRKPRLPKPREDQLVDAHWPAHDGV